MVWIECGRGDRPQRGYLGGGDRPQRGYKGSGYEGRPWPTRYYEGITRVLEDNYEIIFKEYLRLSSTECPTESAINFLSLKDAPEILIVVRYILRRSGAPIFFP